MKSTTPIAAILAVALLAAGCGDPLRDGSFQGEPLYTLSGQISVQDEVLADEAQNVRIAVLWLGDLQRSYFDYGVAKSTFPANYTLDVFQPPFKLAMRRLEGTKHQFAVARIVLYDDANQNNAIDANERIVGGSNGKLLGFFTGRGDSSALGEYKRGYQLLNVGDCQQGGGSLIKVSRPDKVDLVLADINIALPNLECEEFLPNDICFDLLEQVASDRDAQGQNFDPESSEAARIYDEACGDAREPPSQVDPGEPEPEPDPIDCNTDSGNDGDPNVQEICSEGTQDYCVENLHRAIDILTNGQMTENPDGNNDQTAEDADMHFRNYHGCMGDLSSCFELLLDDQSNGEAVSDDYKVCALEENNLSY